MIWLATTWARFAASFPQMIDVVMKHWQKFLVLLLVAIIYNQNFMTLQVFKVFGIETIPHLKQEWQLTKEDLDQCKQNKLVLESKIATLNDQIDRWAKVSSALQQKQNNLVAEIARLKAQSNQQVTDVLEGPVPESCEAAIDYLKQSAGVSE